MKGFARNMTIKLPTMTSKGSSYCSFEIIKLLLRQFTITSEVKSKSTSKRERVGRGSHSRYPWNFLEIHVFYWI